MPTTLFNAEVLDETSIFEPILFFSGLFFLFFVSNFKI